MAPSRFALATGLAAALTASAAAAVPAPSGGAPPAIHAAYRPWIEGVDPPLENRLFYATYGALRSHNVLKVYAFAAGGYESAGIRFSARVPHEQRDLTLEEMAREAVILIRVAFDTFPQVEQVDVWATIPVAQSEQTSIESTVFSVSADRPTYERIARRFDLRDDKFLEAFGRVWAAPQVPR